MVKILVIDDDPFVRFTLSKILSRGGYEVHLAENGVQGLHLFQKVKPDVVITDIVMPIKEGLDTIRLLRSWSQDLKIVAISGGSRLGPRNLLDEAAELGATAVLTKPFEPTELLAKVVDCLGVAQSSPQ
jgi:CheY-like chemotaxis protein